MTIMMMGNLDGFLQSLGRDTVSHQLFDSSRVIIDGSGAQTKQLTNFLFSTYSHADMHPHVMSIPFILIFIALLYEFPLVFRPRMFFKHPAELAGRLFNLAIGVGSLGFINGLDLPSFGLLFAAVVFFTFLRSFGSRMSEGNSLLLYLPCFWRLGPRWRDLRIVGQPASSRLFTRISSRQLIRRASRLVRIPEQSRRIPDRVPSSNVFIGRLSRCAIRAGIAQQPTILFRLM